MCVYLWKNLVEFPCILVALRKQKAIFQWINGEGFRKQHRKRKIFSPILNYESFSTEFQNGNLCWTVSKKTGNRYLAHLKGRGEGKLSLT